MAESWRVHLEATNPSPKTFKLQLSGVWDLRSFLEANGMPTDVNDLNHEHIETYLVQLRDRTSASTAATRYRGLRQLFKWLEEEGEFTRNPFAPVRPSLPTGFGRAISTRISPSSGSAQKAGSPVPGAPR
ncbi:MAG: phage integrase N-terminal SAM-like domain-containing protein [Actinomycetota bacterium]